MKKLILFFVFAAIVLQFTSCKVEDDPTNDNPDVTSVVIDTTLKSFYVKPTPSSTFESIYAYDFSTSPLFINSTLFINLNWNDAVEEHGVYLNFTTTTGDALIDGNGFLIAFDSGIKIDSTLAGTWSGYDDGVFSYDYIANPSANKGNLAGQGDKYIVFRAYDGDAPQNKYYGWLRVNVAANGRDIKVLSVGFQKNANTSLRTGEL